MDELENFSGMGRNPYDTPSHKDAYRYELGPKDALARKPPTPRESWQAREYERVMGQEPPDGDYEQFQYNPRTKAGKALLNDLVASQGHSDA